MSEDKEKKQLSLSDLGLSKEDTPAEVAAKKEKVTVEKSAPQPETANTNSAGVINAKVDENAEEHFVSGYPKKNVIRPEINHSDEDNKPASQRNVGTDYSKLEVVSDINKIAKNPIKKEKSPYEKTRDTLLELADKGIDRTKKELTKPGGRIDYAKHEYIRTKYDQLMERAKNNKRLADKINTIKSFMDTTPNFDDATDYQKKGYILFTVARDNKVETNDEFFGLQKQKANRLRNSHDVSEDIKKVTEEKSEDIDIYDDSKTTILSDEEPVIPFKEEKEEEEKEYISNEIKPEEDITEEEAEVKEEDSVLQEDDSFDDPDEEVELSEEQQKAILSKYKNEIVDELGIKKSRDLEGFAIADRSIKLNSALDHSIHTKKTTTWGLQFSGIPIEMIPFSGEELISLNPQQTAYDTVAGLRTVFSIIWRHIANPHKPKFDIWLKQISDYDVDCLLFAVYAANFKDTNILTYECPNKKCKNVFIKKFPIEDMVLYPNDEVKEKFHAILRKDTEGTSLYRTRPIAINEDYAIGFVSQSVYSNLFEPASLSDDFTKKFKPIIDIMPNIDKVYKIDQENKTLIPISFGKSDTLQKTVMRKVKGLIQIMKSFTPDERAIVISEAGKISVEFNSKRIQYRIPATKCPVCGHEIEEQIVTPLDLLFTRAQLPIIAASIQE